MKILNCSLEVRPDYGRCARFPGRWRFIMLICTLAWIGCGKAGNQPVSEFGIVIHGGSGSVSRTVIPPEEDPHYREALSEALRLGYDILLNGGTSLDAVEAAVRSLEDHPLFNAGRGAVFTAEGTNELDASIMDGRMLNAGAVAGVRRIKNPVTLARLVMEESEHVMMAQDGAEDFGRQFGIETVPEDYFFTERRREQLQQVRDRASDEPGGGTVGAVALDKHGNLAAATSTGGMTNKRYGRIGDSPVIGAGTYANNETCAVSATGHGEYIIRSVVAYDISALMEYAGMTLADAAERVVMERLAERGGSGGIISIDRNGNVALSFNTEGMHRGYVLDDGIFVVKLYGDE
jgi:L-asparaginase / beta-aspartyl-peptidase